MLLDRTSPVEPTCPARWRLAAKGCTALAVVAVSLITTRPTAVASDGPKPVAAQVVSNADVSARLLDPEGKPVAGAKVYLSERKHTLRGDVRPANLLGTTDREGTFRYPPQARKVSEGGPWVVAVAEGFGPAFLDPGDRDAAKVATLVRDDVPVRGQLVDSQGKPLGGATVQVVGIHWHPSGRLDEWLAKLKQEGAAFPVEYAILRSWGSDDIPSIFPALVTDGEGRFTLKGVGRERIVSILIRGAGLETKFEYVSTRTMPAVKSPDFHRQNFSSVVVYHGPESELTVPPGRVAVGMVTDADTGKPLAGVRVEMARLFGNPLRLRSTTTDAEGRYRLEGIPAKDPRDDDMDLIASVGDGPPYTPAARHLGQSRDASPVTVDFKLKRGIWVRGRVVDAVTRQGVLAGIAYYIPESNPFRKVYPSYGTIHASPPFTTDPDGTFKLAVLPGRGVIGVRAWDDRFRLGVGTQAIKEAEASKRGNIIVPAYPDALVPVNYHTLAVIEPREGEESIACEVKLELGRAMRGRVVGPDGKPLAGARIEGLEDHFRSWSQRPLPTAEFVVDGLGPGAGRDLLVYHEGQKLAGAYAIRPDEAGPITVKLGPSGTILGRLVDREGKPQAGRELECFDRMGDETHEHGSLPAGAIKTDADGRFRAEGIVPGRKYTFRLWSTGPQTPESGGHVPVTKGIVVAPGETKDLGDVRAEEVGIRD